MPTRARISAANVDDCRMGQNWPIQAETVYVFDKGYCDYNWWWKLEQQQAYFVTRLKSNAKIRMIENIKLTEGKILEEGLFEL